MPPQDPIFRFVFARRAQVLPGHPQRSELWYGPRPAVRPEGCPMKTLTEFSGTLVRMAAKAVAEARKKLPKEAFALRVPPPEPDTKPDVEPHDNHNEAAPEEGIDSPSDAADEELAKDA